MKRIVLLILWGCVPFGCFAQSMELKNCYNQVAHTLKEFKFQSEDVHKCNFECYQTKSISMRLTNGYFVFTLKDGYTGSGAYHPNAHPGVKTISILINEVTFKLSSTQKESWITISGTNGIEYNLNNKKELLDDYKLYASRLTMKKVFNELEALQNKASSEQFKGSLGSSKSNNKTNSIINKTKSSSTQKTNNVGRYVQ